MKTVSSYILVTILFLMTLIGCNRADQTLGDAAENTESFSFGDMKTEEHITVDTDAKDAYTVDTVFKESSVIQVPSVQDTTEAVSTETVTFQTQHDTTDADFVSEEVSIDTENQLPAPYVLIKEGDKKAFDAINWVSVLKNIPSDHYVLYPGTLGCPVTATLYKDEAVINLDVNDPRLVQMLNFYNNTIYHGLYSLTQGSYTPEGQESIRNAPYRIELTYVPELNDGFIENSFDLFIIKQSLETGWGDFVGFRTNIPYGSYPSSAFGRSPLFQSYGWLTLFGF